MDKCDVIEGLRENGRRWQAVLDEVGLARMDQPGVNGEFFDHFHDDHEPNVRAWLARGATSAPGAPPSG